MKTKQCNVRMLQLRLKMSKPRYPTISRAPKHRYSLIELTACPQKGATIRQETMTDIEAKRRNAQMSGTIVEWRE